MEFENIELKLNVRKNNDSRYGDANKAIEEAALLSHRLGVPCSLTYANQVTLYITPDMSIEEIKSLKNQQVIIGM